MRTEVLAALALAMAMPPDTIIYEERKERPKYPGVPDDFIVRPSPAGDTVTTSTKRAYIGEVVHVNVPAVLREQVIAELKAKRLANKRKLL